MITLNRIRHLIVNFNLLPTVDLYLQASKNSLVQAHFIVLCDSYKLEEYLPVLCELEYVQCIYLHMPLDSLEQYKTLIERFSKIISILQHSNTLCRMILHDFAYYSIKQGQIYQKEKKNKLANIRYEYALFLQTHTEVLINEKLQLLKQN